MVTPIKIYLIPGLGADYRVFQNLDFGSFEPVYIHWIKPMECESIESYALRLTDQIKTENPIIIGISFGGMIASEIAKLINTRQLILIASAANTYEIPFYIKWAGILRLHKIVPTKMLLKANALTFWFFGVKTNYDNKILKGILCDTDPDFLAWAIDKIVNWKNTTTPSNLIQIHGTKDRILPAEFVIPLFRINGGGHLMTLDKPHEISKIIKKTISS